jgi:hypothetical protein
MTTTHTYPCHNAYERGIANRKKYPFVASSLYKIKEFHHQLESHPSNLVNIGKCFLGDKNACHRLIGCVSFDKAIYAKKIPSHIAYNLGFKLVSALPLLKHEGLTKHDLYRISTHVNAEAKRLIDLAEHSSIELKTNWPLTARHLASGKGAIYELSLDVFELVDWVLTEVNLCK